MGSSPDDSYEKKRERYEQEKKDLLANANALFEKHPAFSRAEITIYERTLSLQSSEPLESLEKGTEARLTRTLKALDIRASAYLELVLDLDHLKAFRQKLNWFVWEAWMHFCGFPLEMVPAPHPTTPLSEHQAHAKRFWDRAQHWFIEGHRRIDQLRNPSSGSPEITSRVRQGYRREIDVWMKREGLRTLDQARRRLGVSKDTLKSIRSDKGEKKYGDDTLADVLRKIAFTGE